jgi:hypothetical protein
MSVRIHAAAAALLITSCLFQTPALAQLTAEEQVAAQNFNGIDIAGDSTGSSQNNSLNAGMQNFGQGMNAGQNGFNNSNQRMYGGISSQLNSQNTQLGQSGMFNNGAQNNGMSNGIDNNMFGMNSSMSGVANSGLNGMNGFANNGINETNGMNGGMNNSAMQNGFSNGMCNGMSDAMPNGMNNNGGGIVQSIGNSIMSDPKMMQRAVGVAGAAALLGVFVGNGGVGGLMRSAGMDNSRHIRGPGGGY